MINENELAKEIEAAVLPRTAPFTLPTGTTGAPKLKEIDKGRVVKMLGQMNDIISGLGKEIDGLVEQRAALNRKIIDAHMSLIASEAAAQVLALVDNDRESE